jgi:hypothetical protein
MTNLGGEQAFGVHPHLRMGQNVKTKVLGAEWEPMGTHLKSYPLLIYQCYIENYAVKIYKWTVIHSCDKLSEGIQQCNLATPSSVMSLLKIRSSL